MIIFKKFFIIPKENNENNKSVNDTGKLHRFIGMYGEPIYDFFSNGEAKKLYTLCTDEIAMILEEPQRIQSDLGVLCVRKLLLSNGMIGYIIWDTGTINYFQKITELT